MGYKILSKTRRGKIHEFFVRGDTSWTLLDLYPYMVRVSDKSKDFKLKVNPDIDIFEIDYLPSDKIRLSAEFFLKNTLDPRINRIIVKDSIRVYGSPGIGAQMIKKYVHSIENPLE